MFVSVMANGLSNQLEYKELHLFNLKYNEQNENHNSTFCGKMSLGIISCSWNLEIL